MTWQNRIYVALTWLLILVFFALIITWAAVVIPATLTLIFAAFVVLFVIGNLARAGTIAIVWLRDKLKRNR